MTSPTPTNHEREFNPIAAVLAWLWPGLGHISLGHRKRGFLIMFGVLFLFLGGVLIGGVDCVDRVQDRLWFLAQSVCGPIAFATDMVNQSYIKHLPEVQQYPMIALNKPNEMGTLFCALAGLMNLVVILDALYLRPNQFPTDETPDPVNSLLAYIPFLNPLNIFHEWWYLLIVPLSFGISVIYKAVRMATLDQFWKQVLLMTAQVVLAMIGLAICLVILVVLVIPHLPVE